MADVRDLLAGTAAEFERCLAALPAGAGPWPTPNDEWDVTALAAHVVDEQWWAPGLLAGRALEDVAGGIPADPLGADPVAACATATRAMLDAAAGVGLDDTVQLSFGPTPAEEYLHQLAADHLVHAWDLARATGGDERLDATLVEQVATWFADREDLYRAGGVIGPAVAVAGDDAQDRLLGAFGRDPSPDDPLAVLVRFNDAFGRQDVDGIMAAMTDDCVFEDTTPPDGGRHEGQAAVRAAWEALFSANPDGVFTTESARVAGTSATYRWVYDWGGGHVRGVDVFRVADGKVAEKLSYVKG